MPKQLVVPLTVALTLAIVACSPSGKSAPGGTAGGSGWPTSPAAIAAYQQADRQQMLEAGAKEEGTVTWYTTLVAGIQDELVKQFQAKYPYIKVNVVRTGDINTRVMQEVQAKKSGFDVYDTSPPVGQQLLDLKAIIPYFSPSTKSYPDTYRKSAANNLTNWAMLTFDCLGFGYNTNLLPASAVPKTYQDLLSPALKDKMVISGASGVNVVGDIISTQPNGQQLAQQIAKQQNVNVQQVSALATLDLVASGEFAASPSVYEPHILQAQAKGAPVKWVPLEPAACVDYNEVLSLRAQHPHAALLWLDFIFGPDGQKVVQDLQYDSPAHAPSYKTYFPDQNISVDDYAKKVDFQQQFFQQYYVGAR